MKAAAFEATAIWRFKNIIIIIIYCKASICCCYGTWFDRVVSVIYSVRPTDQHPPDITSRMCLTSAIVHCKAQTMLAAVLTRRQHRVTRRPNRHPGLSNSDTKTCTIIS